MACRDRSPGNVWPIGAEAEDWSEGVLVSPFSLCGVAARLVLSLRGRHNYCSPIPTASLRFLQA